MCKQFYSTQERANEYKYTLWLRMEQFTKAKHRNVKKRLPVILGVNHRTFENWMYIKADENKTIPADSLYQLSTFFGCSVAEMFTHTPPSLWLDNIKIDSEIK